MYYDELRIMTNYVLRRTTYCDELRSTTDYSLRRTTYYDVVGGVCREHEGTNKRNETNETNAAWLVEFVVPRGGFLMLKGILKFP